MDFEHLRDVWRRETGPERAPTPDEDLDAVRARAAALEQRVRRRDLIEIGVALVMLPFFVWLAVTVSRPLSAIGAAIVAGGCVLVPIRLFLARRRRPADPGLPVAVALRAELSRMRAQERLLSSTLWWYFAPLGAGVILFVAGSSASLLFKTTYAVLVVTFYGWLLRLNHRAARDQFAPVARQLERWLANLDESIDHGGSNADRS